MNYPTKQRNDAAASQVVKIGTSRQVAIPKKIYEQLHLATGDYLEISIENDHLILTPKVFIEKRFTEEPRNIKTKRTPQPFSKIADVFKPLKNF